MSERVATKETGDRAPVAVVTGGRRGIGQACAFALAETGFDVVIIDLAEDADAKATLDGIGKRTRGGRMVIGDIADLDGHAALMDRVFGAFGTVDCLVNNAGVLSDVRGKDLLEVRPENYDRVMTVNLRGTFFLTQAVARRMVAESDTGRPVPRSIITISSATVGRVRTDSPEYSFSKTGLSLMSQMFALRLGRHGISTYEIRPGVTKTEMSRDAWPIYDALVEEGRFPIARLGLPEDIGRAVATLAGGGLSYCTGGHFYIDGGFGIPASQSPRRKA